MMGCCTHIYYSKCLTVLECEASREVANLTERKNPLTPVFGVKEFVCLSVCLLPNSIPIISGLAKPNGLKFFLGHLWQEAISQNFLFVRKMAGRARAEGQNCNVCKIF